MPTTAQLVTDTIVRLSTLALYALVVFKTHSLLTFFINSRKGKSLFRTQRITKEQAIDTVRRHGLEVTDGEKIVAA